LLRSGRAKEEGEKKGDSKTEGGLGGCSVAWWGNVQILHDGGHGNSAGWLITMKDGTVGPKTARRGGTVVSSAREDREMKKTGGGPRPDENGRAKRGKNFGMGKENNQKAGQIREWTSGFRIERGNIKQKGHKDGKGGRNNRSNYGRVRTGAKIDSEDEINYLPGVCTGEAEKGNPKKVAFEKPYRWAAFINFRGGAQTDQKNIKGAREPVVRGSDGKGSNRAKTESPPWFYVLSKTDGRGSQNKGNARRSKGVRPMVCKGGGVLDF